MQYTLPTVHLNGSSRERLFDGYHAAYKATVAARTALRMVEFHARDYYIKDGAWLRALSEREQQFDHLGAVMQFLEAHLTHLAPADAGDTQ